MDTTNVLDEAYLRHQYESSEKSMGELAVAMRAMAKGVTWQTLHQVVEDVVDESVYKGLLKLPTFRGNSKFSTWFYRVCRNEALMWLRRREVPLSEELEAPQPVNVQEMLVGLKPEVRQVVQMKMEGYSDEEIAEELGVTRQTIWRWLRKLRP